MGSFLTFLNIYDYIKHETTSLEYNEEKNIITKAERKALRKQKEEERKRNRTIEEKEYDNWLDWWFKEENRSEMLDQLDKY